MEVFYLLDYIDFPRSTGQQKLHLPFTVIDNFQ